MQYPWLPRNPDVLGQPPSSSAAVGLEALLPPLPLVGGTSTWMACLRPELEGREWACIDVAPAVAEFVVVVVVVVSLLLHLAALASLDPLAEGLHTC